MNHLKRPTLVALAAALVTITGSAAAAETVPTAAAPAAETAPAAATAPAAGTTPAAATTTPAITAATGTAAVDDATKGQYALGYQLGRELATAPDRSQAMIDGFRDGRSGAAPRYPEQEMQAALQTLGQQVNEQRAKLAAAEAGKQNAVSTAFLAENAKKPLVQTTASGLQYKVVEPGTGRKPGPDDTVTVHYRGTLIDGTEFDSSYKRGEPAKFPVGGVIAGWTEALQLMNQGAKWQLFIPSSLAYGDRGPLANRLLIFDVELIDVAATDAPATDAPK